MPLNDFRRTTAKIEAGDISFEVGHLTLSDLATLRRLYVVKGLETLDAYKLPLLHPDAPQRTYGAASVLLEMSDAVSHAIALACLEPDSKEKAAALPVGIQVRALIEILRLTSANEALGGATENVLSLLTDIQTLRPEELN